MGLDESAMMYEFGLSDLDPFSADRAGGISGMREGGIGEGADSHRFRNDGYKLSNQMTVIIGMIHPTACNASTTSACAGRFGSHLKAK